VPAPWGKWAIHQYSISGNIDRDVTSWTTRTAMTAALGKTKKAETPVNNLGGSLSGDALASARWANGVTVVAGVDATRRVVVNRWADGDWSGWKVAAAGPVKGAPSLTVWPDHGHLYYTATDGSVVQLASNDHGATWS
jgi:hypothetical protein